MSRIRANQITNQSADGAPTVQHGLIISGVTTVTGSINNLNLTGITTISTLDLNGDLDVDGHINLDNISVAGVSTFTGNADFSAGIDVTGNVTGTGDLTLTSTDTGSSASPIINLFRNSASPADADYIGQIKFQGESDTGTQRNYAKITGKILDASNGTEDGILEFAHIKAGSQTITGRWRSDSLQLLNGTALTVAGSTTVTGNIIPSSDSATDIGTNSVRFANLYADTLYGDGSNLTGTGGVTSDAQYNTVGGTNSGDSFSGTSAQRNTLFGYDAGTAITTGDNHVALGAYALDALTTAGDAVAIGYNAGSSLTVGQCVLIGSKCAPSATTASGIVGVGYEVYQYLTDGNYNTAVGSQSMNRITSGEKNSSYGALSLIYAQTSDENTALGYQALGREPVTGNSNTAVGCEAGATGTNDITSGANNILLGYKAQATSATVSNEVTIGNSNITKFRIPGINFILKDNGGTPTQGHVLTVDANG